MKSLFSKSDSRAKAPDPDAQRMLALGQGDEQAFMQLYDKYRDKIINFGRRFLGDVERAEEAAQDVFLNIYKARFRYKADAKFSTYIYRAMHNHCLNIAARHEYAKRDSGVQAIDVATSEPQQSHEAENNDLKRALHTALSQLDDKPRSALLLCHYHEHSYKEAADVLEISESALKSMLHRARSNMMQSLQPFMQADMPQTTHSAEAPHV